jgi:hypothetical protein
MLSKHHIRAARKPTCIKGVQENSRTFLAQARDVSTLRAMRRDGAGTYVAERAGFTSGPVSLVDNRLCFSKLRLYQQIYQQFSSVPGETP